MASTVTAEARRATSSDEWLDDVKVTFDSGEMADFFDRFSPLEIGEDLVPVVPAASNDDR